MNTWYSGYLFGFGTAAIIADVFVVGLFSVAFGVVIGAYVVLTKYKCGKEVA